PVARAKKSCTHLEPAATVRLCDLAPIPVDQPHLDAGDGTARGAGPPRRERIGENLMHQLGAAHRVDDGSASDLFPFGRDTRSKTLTGGHIAAHPAERVFLG